MDGLDGECAISQNNCLCVQRSAGLDPLDDLFTAMRVQSALYARLETSAPWGLDFAGGTTARFGFVVHGACYLTAEGRDSIRLIAGDCYVLVHGSRYILQDNLSSPTQSCSEVVRDHVGGTVLVGGGGEPATIITGWFRFDEIGARPLVEFLPRVLHTRIDQERAELLPALLQLVNIETETPALGSNLVVSRLADILFVQVLRAYVPTESESGWLAALSDRQIGLVLKAIHREPAYNWTVEAMAITAGMSRSAFAVRFKECFGEPPLAYLTRWRMFKAGDLLRQGKLSIGEISARVGYESEAAFNKAFKRLMGTTPAKYRHSGR